MGTWLIWAILTVILWGTSETIFKKVSTGEKHSVLKLIAYNGIVLGVFGIIYMLINGAKFDIQKVLLYLPNALIYIASMFCTYKAMTLVKVSIMSPLQNSDSALTAILCVTLLKQDVPWYQVLAIIAVVLGMILIVRNKDEVLRIESGDKEADEKASKKAYLLYVKGIAFALGYWVLDGVASFIDDSVLDGQLTDVELQYSYGFVYAIVGIIALLILKFKYKESYTFLNFKKNKWKWIGTLVESVGQYTYILAMAGGPGAIVAPFTGAYSIVTILLSRIFLKEKLTKMQMIIIGIIFAGLVVLSLEPGDATEEPAEENTTNEPETVQSVDANQINEIDENLLNSLDENTVNALAG